ncbi:MAG: cytochrome c biogenesis protein CcsA [Phycisphaerales bacterium]
MDQTPIDTTTDTASAEPVRRRNNKRAFLVWGVATVLFAALAGWVTARIAGAGAGPQPSAFAQQVDLTPLKHTAVYTQGRLKSFPSFADSFMRAVVGPRQWRGQTHEFTYFDMLFRPEAYAQASVIYVSKKPMRAQIVSRLAQRQDLDPAYLDRFLETGMIAPALLEQDPAVRELLIRLRADAIKTAKHVDAVETALALRQPVQLSANLRLIPPPGGDSDDMWRSITDIWTPTGAPSPGVPGLDAETNTALAGAWRDLAVAWRAEDAEGAGAALATFAALAPTVAPEVYPARARLGWETRYYQQGHMTWVWLVYMLAVVLLLLAVVYRWRFAQWSGLTVYLIALGLHTFAVMLRWYVAGRWPNSNMFEAVTTSAWFGAVGALVFEAIVRKTPMRNLFMLGAAVSSMAALMAAHYMPVSLNPGVGNMMPILHDVWLYIHTNVIIFSYVLIAMAAVSAILYLLHRAAGGQPDYARAGGAGAIMAMGAASADELARKRVVTPAQVLDGVTMVLMELSFVLLWAGIVMGAIWADHSWGRPWGWDPKEVFALNTFIVFVLLVHTRLKVRDKGLWTAILAVFGCVAMLFNWIVINFIISGLHSYA